MDVEAALAAFHLGVQEAEPKFERFFLARLLGLTFKYEDESCVVSLDVKDFLFNPQGTLHGGIIATVLDISMGHLLHHTLGAGTTLEMKVQYLRPARQEPLACRAQFVQRGRSICFLHSTLQDARGQAIADASATWKILRSPLANLAQPTTDNPLKEMK